MLLVLLLMLFIAVLIGLLLKNTLFKSTLKTNQRVSKPKTIEAISKVVKQGFALLSIKKDTALRKDPVVSEPTVSTEKNRSNAKSQADSTVHECADTVLGLNETVKVAETPPEDAKQSSPNNAPIISLALLAPDQKPYGGYELLQSLLSNSLRFGEKQIFHRFKSSQPDSEILFSCASIAQPGTFDLGNMGGFSTPGLVLFFDSAKVNDPKHTFSLLLQTLDSMIDDMGGRVYDDKRQPFTKHGLHDVHQQIDQYLKTCHTLDLFEN